MYDCDSEFGNLRMLRCGRVSTCIDKLRLSLAVTNVVDTEIRNEFLDSETWTGGLK